jgi:c-di-GMP-binding flagellar brake protein YcgR
MSRPENLLFRSHIEISRIMQVLAQEHCAISSEIGSDYHFSSHILSINLKTNHFYIAYSTSKLLNAKLLAASSIEFTATDPQNLHFTFNGATPEETLIDDQPVIQFELPKVLLLHNQREHSRLPIPADVSLRCVADEAGIIPFESHVTDVSHDGLGCLIYNPDINLEKGAILKSCRIIIPNGDAVITDIVLRHITTVTLPDGTIAHRAGFRFARRTPEQQKVINLFIQDMDKAK